MSQFEDWLAQSRAALPAGDQGGGGADHQVGALQAREYPWVVTNAIGFTATAPCTPRPSPVTTDGTAAPAAPGIAEPAAGHQH
ncbi:hypothetical protein ACFYMW_38845 [Streptomyces sp. NPDC006692]|uniref:hypothetical protein n=1 Tax=Streptomyces sp. NPDC006692 TaxID=3364758 RepID=UPI00369661D2